MKPKIAWQYNGKLVAPLRFQDLPNGTLVRYKNNSDNVKKVIGRAIIWPYSNESIEPFKARGVKLETVSGNKYSVGGDHYFLNDMVTCICHVQISYDKGITWQSAHREVKDAVFIGENLRK